MTLGIFLPVMLVMTGIFELWLIGRLRAKIPTRMDVNYNGEESERRRRALTIVMIGTVLAPIIAYVILNVLMPDAGSIVIF